MVEGKKPSVRRFRESISAQMKENEEAVNTMARNVKAMLDSVETIRDGIRKMQAGARKQVSDTEKYVHDFYFG